MVQDNPREFDVVILGGGPAGSTCGSFLRKWAPHLSTLIVEKETFPRDHVGESQLPGCAQICAEMGCWEKVEAAGFPVKIGASYTWGRTQDVWDFNFIDPSTFDETQARPSPYEGPRRQTAFQVDRSVYDKILLDHAAELGCEVVQGVGAKEIHRDGDAVSGITLSDGSSVRARHYVDATGAAGALRRAMGVETWSPKSLRNVAFWGYWRNAEWAVRIGVGATYVQVRSLPYGWIWFIPMGPDRTSIGLICHSDYYKGCGLSGEELYHKAVREQALVAEHIENAEFEGEVFATKDWSHCAERLVGDNWYLIGEAAGFADPILAAGMLVGHRSGQDLAATINEIEIGEVDAAWLRTRFDEKNRRNIQQYIRFAQFWYAANGCFTDLQEQCVEIAREGGLKMNPEQAWRWLSQGGFAIDDPLRPTVGSYDVFSAKDIASAFIGGEQAHAFEKYNVFKLNIYGAERDALGVLDNQAGRIRKVPCLRKGEQVLPLAGFFGTMVQILQRTPHIGEVVQVVQRQTAGDSPGQQLKTLNYYMATLESMVRDGWVTPKVDKKRPFAKRPETLRGDGRKRFVGGRV